MVRWLWSVRNAQVDAHFSLPHEQLQENTSDIEENVPAKFKLEWSNIKFAVLLGSGTFGDCYKGSLGLGLGSKYVAVSIARSRWTKPREI